MAPPRRAGGATPPKGPQVFNCRYRPKEGAQFRETEFLTRREDGTIDLIDPKGYGIRTVFSERVEFKARGPRGGVRWVPATEQDEPDGL